MVRPASPWATFYVLTGLMHVSTTAHAPRGSKRRVYAICIPLDELSAHARNQRAEYDSHVGYIPGW